VSVTGRILIIDDETALRQTLARILQRAGHTVTTAESAQVGLSLLANTTFDLVYMDIRMPGMSGLEALGTIHAAQPTLPVVLFTAQPDMNSAVEALRFGAIDYLLKPLQPQILIERTEAILVQQQKERRKREIQTQIQSLQNELNALEHDVQFERPALFVDASDDRFLSRGNLTLDLHTRRVTVGEQVINLPPTAFDYLLALARHSPNVVDYQTLVTEAQGYQAEAREAQELVKRNIHQIRQLLEGGGEDYISIVNVRGSGYRLVVD